MLEESMQMPAASAKTTHPETQKSLSIFCLEKKGGDAMECLAEPNV